MTALTDSENPRRYWSDLKIKLAKEGSQLYEEIVQLKLRFLRAMPVDVRSTSNNFSYTWSEAECVD